MKRELFTSLVNSTVSSSRLKTASVSIAALGRKRLLVCKYRRCQRKELRETRGGERERKISPPLTDMTWLFSHLNTHFPSAICDDKGHWHGRPFTPVRGRLLTVPQDDDLTRNPNKNTHYHSMHTNWLRCLLVGFCLCPTILALNWCGSALTKGHSLVVQ